MVKKIYLEIIACVETARFFVAPPRQHLHIINDAATGSKANNKGMRNGLLNLRTSINNEERYQKIKGTSNVYSISTSFEYIVGGQEFFRLALNFAAKTAEK